MDAAAALALFDAQLRRIDGQPAGLVYRNASPAGNWVVHSDLTADNADQVIAEQQEYFAGVGGPVEWKHYGYDQPADLPERLGAARVGAQPTQTPPVARGGGPPPG